GQLRLWYLQQRYPLRQRQHNLATAARKEGLRLAIMPSCILLKHPGEGKACYRSDRTGNLPSAYAFPECEHYDAKECGSPHPVALTNLQVHRRHSRLMPQWSYHAYRQLLPLLQYRGCCHAWKWLTIHLPPDPAPAPVL